MEINAGFQGLEQHARIVRSHPRTAEYNVRIDSRFQNTNPVVPVEAAEPVALPNKQTTNRTDARIKEAKRGIDQFPLPFDNFFRVINQFFDNSQPSALEPRPPEPTQPQSNGLAVEKFLAVYRKNQV